MKRLFTHQQATLLLPEVETLLLRAIEARQRIQDAEAGLAELAQKVQMSGGMLPNPATARQYKEQRESAALALREAIESVHALGAQVKDLDTGLVDFPTEYRDQEVLLCWKLGESAISWWHGMEDGFGGRRPIDDDFLRNHRGAASH
jgi:hypothetical protein